MVVGVCTLEFYLPENHSLKGKRQVINSIKGKLKSRFNISIAEIGYQDVWQRSALGIAMISGERRYIEREFSKILNFIDRSQFASYLLDYSLEYV